MIALITGVLVYRSPGWVVVDVNGVGYRLHIPLSTFYKLPEEGTRVSLHTYTCVREDAFHLYGFLSAAEKELFEKLISVSKVGPKLGLNLLSGLAADDLQRAIAGQDVARLSSIPGVGLKTAERLILELKDKMAAMPEEAEARGGGLSREEAAVFDDVLTALLNLGYRRREADKELKRLWDDGERKVEVLLKKALARLAT